jgi:transposase
MTHEEELEMLTETKATAVRYWEEAIVKAMSSGMSARTVAKYAGVSHVTCYRVFKARTAGAEVEA